MLATSYINPFSRWTYRLSVNKKLNLNRHGSGGESSWLMTGLHSNKEKESALVFSNFLITGEKNKTISKYIKRKDHMN
jgi:hypothetical protein